MIHSCIFMIENTSIWYFLCFHPVFAFWLSKKVVYTWFWWGWGRSSPSSQRCSCLLGPWERRLSTGSSDAQNNTQVQDTVHTLLKWWTFSISATYLGRWQSSSSLWAHRQHGEFPDCAALTVWRRSEGVPLWTSQHVLQIRVNQGYLPLCGDVVTGEISTNGRRWVMKWNTTAQRSVWNKSNCGGHSLQWFIHHATSSKARLVEQHLTKVIHLSIHRTLITVMDKKINTSDQHIRKYPLLVKPITLTWRMWTVARTSRERGSDLDTLRKVEQSEWMSALGKRNCLAAQSTTNGDTTVVLKEDTTTVQRWPPRDKMCRLLSDLGRVISDIVTDFRLHTVSLTSAKKSL